MTGLYANPPAKADPVALHDALYDGAIVRFRDLAPMRALIAAAQGFAEEFLAPHPPIEIHRHLAQHDLAERLGAAQRAFSNSTEITGLWHSVLAGIGLDAAATARDRVILRFQPPHPPEGRREYARSTATVGFHRDTWGTNLYAQVNWWAPVFPITAGRTFAFYPDLFARPLANSSADFDIAEAMRRHRDGTLRAGESVPRLLEDLDPAGARPVTMEPGELIAFSSQHAHVGIDNHTDLTRISLDTRTLSISDHLAGRGARNVDGRARWVAYSLFRRMSDGKPLAAVLGVDPLAPFDGPFP